MNETQFAPTSSQPSSTDQFKEKASQLKTQAGELVGAAKNVAGEKLTGLKEGASALYKASADKMCAVKDGTADYVSKNPLKSVLVAAGVGLLAGYILTRRR